MNFIFMLTRQDRTVSNCLDVLAQIAPLGLLHIGFKDIGVEAQTLGALHAGIKALGAVSYLEVVATSPQATLHSARLGAELGVDCLLGGTQVEETLNILAGTRHKIFPLPRYPPRPPHAAGRRCGTGGNAIGGVRRAGLRRRGPVGLSRDRGRPDRFGASRQARPGAG